MSDQQNEQAQEISALLEEHRTIEPPKEFTKTAIVNSDEIFSKADKDFEAFWSEQAEMVSWARKWDTVMDWTPPWVKWFVGGKLNIAYNCLDRHLQTNADRVAYYWEGEPGDERKVTYQELYEDVCRFANALKKLGVQKGDRVAIYLGMIPELPVAMLACARIGATHSVVFGGFSAEALKDRINDAQAKVLITADGGWRRGQIVPLKENSDRAVADCPSIEKVVVVQRTKHDINFEGGRDVWY
ncbi:MAG: AMP-binding protein, partial [Acidimicrobiia bacterium]